MKKIFTLLMICSLLLITGCGGGGEEKKPSDDAGKIKLGMITRLNASEENFGEFMKKVEETLDVKISSHKPVFFDTLNAMQMALQSKQIDEISTYRSVARYMIAKDPRYEVLKDHSLEFVDSFCFALRDDETELKDSLNAVIKEMQSDGTLDRLTKEYITDIKADREPPSVELPHFDGADTIKVAVTGDMPGMDCILADGTPAGFNVAFLSELSKRINKNFELVSISSDARGAALSSGQVDALFWVIGTYGQDGKALPYPLDSMKGVAISVPYMMDSRVGLALKK